MQNNQLRKHTNFGKQVFLQILKDIPKFIEPRAKENKLLMGKYIFIIEVTILSSDTKDPHGQIE